MPKSIRRSRGKSILFKRGGFIRDSSVQRFRIGEKKNIYKKSKKKGSSIFRKKSFSSGGDGGSAANMSYANRSISTQYSKKILIEIVKYGDVVQLKEFLIPILSHSDYNIDVRDENGCTPLWWASYNGNFEMVKFLIENGANPNKKSSNNTDLQEELRNTDSINVTHLAHEQFIKNNNRYNNRYNNFGILTNNNYNNNYNNTKKRMENIYGSNYKEIIYYLNETLEIRSSEELNFSTLGGDIYTIPITLIEPNKDNDYTITELKDTLIKLYPNLVSIQDFDLYVFEDINSDIIGIYDGIKILSSRHINIILNNRELNLMITFNDNDNTQVSPYSNLQSQSQSNTIDGKYIYVSIDNEEVINRLLIDSNINSKNNRHRFKNHRQDCTLNVLVALNILDETDAVCTFKKRPSYMIGMSPVSIGIKLSEIITGEVVSIKKEDLLILKEELQLQLDDTNLAHLFGPSATTIKQSELNAYYKRVKYNNFNFSYLDDYDDLIRTLDTFPDNVYIISGGDLTSDGETYSPHSFIILKITRDKYIYIDPQQNDISQIEKDHTNQSLKIKINYEGKIVSISIKSLYLYFYDSPLKKKINNVIISNFATK
jgi:hypothetical protein